MAPTTPQLIRSSDLLQDAYLTENPQLNVFKYSFLRYLNFATDIYRLSTNETGTFGKEVTCTIPRYGDFLTKLYLHIKLPALPKPTDGKYLLRPVISSKSSYHDHAMASSRQ